MVHLNIGTIKTSYYSFTQWIATAGVMMLMLQTGIMAGWTSPNIARLITDNSTIPLTLNEASWVASCLNLGRFGGAIFGALFIELFGTKKAILLIFFPTSISWILLIFASSVEWLYASRIIGGLTFGMCYAIFSLFLGEVSRPAIRGTMISFAMCGPPLGNVIGSVAETYLPMTISSWIYLSLCLVGIIIFLWLPDSPHHLVKLNDLEGARKSIAWYCGGYEVEKELESIKVFIDSNAGSSMRDKLREFESPPIKKAMIVVIIIFIFPQMCGLFNIMFYMEIILTKAKSFLVNPQQFVVYANIITVVSTILAIRVIDIYGRRFLLIVSSIGTTIAMTGLGIHFYLLDTGIDPQDIQWLPVASILVFNITFAIGFMTVPSTLLSEIFPANIKSIASCLAALTASMFGFVSAKAYQPIVDAVGETYTFWIHAGFSILATPCALFLLPETKGKSLQEIQDDLFKR